MEYTEPEYCIACGDPVSICVCSVSATSKDTLIEKLQRQLNAERERRAADIYNSSPWRRLDAWMNGAGE